MQKNVLPIWMYANYSKTRDFNDKSNMFFTWTTSSMYNHYVLFILQTKTNFCLKIWSLVFLQFNNSENFALAPHFGTMAYWSSMSAPLHLWGFYSDIVFDKVADGPVYRLGLHPILSTIFVLAKLLKSSINRIHTNCGIFPKWDMRAGITSTLISEC